MSVAEAVYLCVSVVALVGSGCFLWGHHYGRKEGFSRAKSLYFTREVSNSGEPKAKRITRTRTAQPEESARVVKAKYRRRR